MQSSRPEQTATEWNDATKRTVAIALVLIGIFVLYISRPVLPFVIVAAILAFLLNPVVSFLSAHLRMPRWLAVIVTYLLVLIGLILLPLILAPALADAVRDIDIDVVKLVDGTTTWLQQFLVSVRHLDVLGYHIDLSGVVDPALSSLTGVVPEQLIPSPEQVYTSLPSALELATGFASTVVGAVVWAVLAFLFTLIYSIYISLDLPQFGDAFLEFVPAPYRGEYTHLWDLIHHIWGAYFRGQLILALIVGTVVGLGTAALGVPGALVLGIVAGLLEAFPNIGPVLASIPGITLALLQGSSVLPISNFVFALIVMLFYILVQQVENNIIVPRLIGQAVEVHPTLVMAGVVVGASVGGILGAFMAAPVIATARIVFQYTLNKLAGRPPFPADQVSEAVQPSHAGEAQSVVKRYALSTFSSLSGWLSGVLNSLRKKDESASGSVSATEADPVHQPDSAAPLED